MRAERLKNSVEILIGISVAIFGPVGAMHGLDHALRFEVILAALALSLALFGLDLLTPRRLIEDREKAARLRQVYNLKPAEAVFSAAGLFAFVLTIYALGLI